ncbi:MAG: polysaccharide biosynthesis/export family protein [Armatimonadetes bacterium]|nr:polysaccharide biosynthesis/export family protein [Armatimonadota bacterium]
MKRLLTLLVLSVCACWSWAQSQNGTYRIQEDDRLGIAVFDEPQIAASVTVLPDGNIVAPFAGIIRAIGKTTAELETELADIYVKKLQLRNPKVSVTILAVRDIQATINGAVAKAGTYRFRPGQTVRDLIAQGGAAPNIGDWKRATFRRKGWNELIPIDLDALITRGNLSQNYEIKDGDELVIPERLQPVIPVVGDVLNPRSIAYDDSMTLLTAISAAGGINPNRGKKSGILVIRPKKGSEDQYYLIKCDLVAYEKGDFQQNIPILPGDSIVVPNNGSPDFSILNQLANAIYVLDRFGIRLFGAP